MREVRGKEPGCDGGKRPERGRVAVGKGAVHGGFMNPPNGLVSGVLVAMIWATVAGGAETTKKEQAAGWLKDAAGALGKTEGAGSAALSVETIVAGLKTGLGTGVDRALAELGRADGFFANANFKIPLPAELARGEQLLRKAKQDKLADDLVLALNRAAEKSVAETAPIFKEAITGMTLADARAILDGKVDAATTYFRKTTDEKLRARMLPIVTAATEANGVGAAYKKFSGQVAPLTAMFGVKPVDLDSYVCERALNGLFKVIATQEAQLRANPGAAADKLLQQVFGAAKKG